MLESLLQAYDEEDAEGVVAALNSPFIKHMDVEYACLARDLPIPRGIPTVPLPASIRHNAAPSYVSPNVSISNLYCLKKKNRAQSRVNYISRCNRHVFL